MILDRRTHLDSLVDKLREERVRRIIEPIAAIEQGKYSPSLEAAFRIARAFGKPLFPPQAPQSSADS